MLLLALHRKWQLLALLCDVSNYQMSSSCHSDVSSFGRRAWRSQYPATRTSSDLSGHPVHWAQYVLRHSYACGDRWRFLLWCWRQASRSPSYLRTQLSIIEMPSLKPWPSSDTRHQHNPFIGTLVTLGKFGRRLLFTFLHPSQFPCTPAPGPWP